MSTSIRPGDVLAGRYRLEDLLSESRGGRFWRAHDRVLDRHVAVHCLSADDDRAPALLDAARRSAAVLDRSILRVLDADQSGNVVFVVNEWGDGASLDIVLAGEGPLDPRHAAWLASEVGASVAAAHQAGVTHGRLSPENVLLDHNGHVRLIGLGVEAALWGLPPDRLTVDVVDLAGVLYAALTGRWAGISSSVVPRAPVEHGHVLRPRQVRAGIPTPLDSLCDQVLNPDQIGTHARAAYDLTTARGITDYLRAFVGDGSDLPATSARLVRRLHAQGPTAGASAQLGRATAGLTTDLSTDVTAEQEPVSTGAPAEQPTTLMPIPVSVGSAPPTEDPPGSGAETGSGPDVGAGAPAPDSAEPSQSPAVEQPTELGLPIFDDESDDVGWLTARATKPPPPPPFEEHPERPLFAPDPEPGQPVRRSRPGAAMPTGEAPWGEPITGTGAPITSGSGAMYLDDDEPLESRVPGRRWLRLGMVILATLLLVLAVLVVLNLSRGRPPLALGTDPGNSATSGSSPTGDGSGSGGAAITGLTAYDLDPQATPPTENPELVPLAIDGDPATNWHTSTYRQNLGPGGLKTGVGLVVDVGEVRALQELSVDLVGGPTAVTIYLAQERPSFIKGLEPVAAETVDGRLQVGLGGASARYVVVWLTSLPRVKGGFRGAIAEVGVTS